MPASVVQLLSLHVTYTLEVAGFGIGAAGSNALFVTLDSNGLYSSATTTLSGSHNFGVGTGYVTTAFSGVNDNNSAAHNEVQATKSFDVTR